MGEEGHESGCEASPVTTPSSSSLVRPPPPSRKAAIDLNADVLERIFSYLSYSDLKSAELTCRAWRAVVAERRLYWRLTKRIAMSKPPFQLKIGGASSQSTQRSKWFRQWLGSGGGTAKKRRKKM